MKLYSLGEGVYEAYKKTKGNERVSYFAAQKKLTRNIMLAYKFEDAERQDDDLYMYGNLHIHVEGDTVTKIENHKGDPHIWFKVDVKEYKRLSRLLGIKMDKFTKKKSRVA